jgi:hypothetical protein
MQLIMMVKSISPSSHGRYNLKKKKIWIKKNKDADFVEIEVEVYDLSDYSIHFYDKNGKIILCKKDLNQLNKLV